MRVTETARLALAWRREARDMPKEGWEHVGEGGGSLWEIHRGPRVGQRITEVAIDATGKGLWVKIGP